MMWAPAGSAADVAGMPVASGVASAVVGSMPTMITVTELPRPPVPSVLNVHDRAVRVDQYHSTGFQQLVCNSQQSGPHTNCKLLIGCDKQCIAPGFSCNDHTGCRDGSTRPQLTVCNMDALFLQVYVDNVEIPPAG